MDMTPETKADIRYAIGAGAVLLTCWLAWVVALAMLATAPF